LLLALFLAGLLLDEDEDLRALLPLELGLDDDDDEDDEAELPSWTQNVQDMS